MQLPDGKKCIGKLGAYQAHTEILRAKDTLTNHWQTYYCATVDFRLS